MPEEIETMDFWKKPPLVKYSELENKHIVPHTPVSIEEMEQVLKDLETMVEYKRTLSGKPVIWEESTGTLELDTKMYATQSLTKEDMVKYIEELFFKDRCPTDAEGAE